MMRQLLVCGLGLVLAGGLGLSATRAPLPPGTRAIGDSDAAQVYGGLAAQKIPCRWVYLDNVYYGCGLQAKPAPMATWCPRCAIPGPGPARVWVKNYVSVQCYECCYGCGTCTLFDACSDPIPSS
jgi:hypothetical protein